MKRKITNWGLYPIQESEVIDFSELNNLASIIKGNNELIARGMGRCYGDASLSSTTLSTLKYNKFLDFDIENGIIACQAGVTLEEVLDVCVPKGWFLPVTPGTKYVTLGGAVASDVHGKNDHKEGSFTNYVTGLSLMNHKGEIIQCGPEINEDLFYATCGGMGLTGIILSVRFSLKKIETSFINQLLVKATNLDEILDLFDKYKESTYSMAWIDCLKGGNGFGRSILYIGEHARENELSTKQKKRKLKIPRKTPLLVPFYFPSFVLSSFFIRMTNSLIYHKNIKKQQRSIIPYEGFFYPLDAIKHWNRIYGKKGFVQYQFVVPQENGRVAMREILMKIRREGRGSFLAVLKAMGDPNGMISFPMKGYTLALDFPIRKGLFEFLDELDEMVLSYNGRIYLTKDARMSKEVLSKSYKSISQFRQFIKFSKNKFQSIQSNRLGITKD
ncbi:MAG: FAD-binding oxidoreductase [Cyclobacteriaceae bacterium]